MSASDMVPRVGGLTREEAEAEPRVTKPERKGSYLGCVTELG